MTELETTTPAGVTVWTEHVGVLDDPSYHLIVMTVSEFDTSLSTHEMVALVHRGVLRAVTDHLYHEEKSK